MLCWSQNAYVFGPARLCSRVAHALGDRCSCFAQEAIDDPPHSFFRQPSRITLEGAFGWHLDPIKLRDLAEPLQERTISQSRREIAEASAHEQRARNRASQRSDRMFLKSYLLLSTDEIFQPDHSAFAFAQELDLFHFALAQRLDPMFQAAHDELIFYAACTQQLIYGGELSA